MARSVLAALLTTFAAPLLAIVALYLVGIVVGDNLLSTGSQLVGQALVINVLLFGIAGAAMSLGALTVTVLHASADAGAPAGMLRAAGAVLRAAPRLLAVQAILLLSLVAAVLLWFALPVAAVVVAIVLRRRHRRAGATGWGRGARTALVLAIPFLPILVIVALTVTSLPSALSRPDSIRALLAMSIDRLRREKRALVAFVVLAGGVSAGLTVLGTEVASIDVASTWSLLLSTAALAGLVCLLMVVIGAAMAILLPPVDAGMPSRASTSRSRGRARGVIVRTANGAARVAVVTVVALFSTLIPSPALADTGEEPVPAEAPASSEAPPAPIEPEPEPLPQSLPESEPAPAPAASEPAAFAAAGGFTTFVQPVLGSPVRIGETQYLSLSVIAPEASEQPLITGMVSLYLDDLDPLTADTKISDFALEYSAYEFAFATDDLPAGTVSLRFAFEGTDDYAPSETTLSHTFYKAAISYTSMQLSPSIGEVAFGSPHSLTLTLESAADGDAQLELYSADTSFVLVSTQPFSIVDGTATVVVDLTGKFAPGSRYINWRIPETATHSLTGSEAPGFTIAATSTTLDLAVPPQSVGSRGQLLATVTGAGGIPVTSGVVVFYADGMRQGEATVHNGVAGWLHTAPAIAEVTWRAVYQHRVAGNGFTSSEDSETVQVVGASPSTPRSVWSPQSNPEMPLLTLTFPTYGSHPVPTGYVRLLSTDGAVLGGGFIANGVMISGVTIIPGTYVIKAEYSGDSIWTPTTFFLSAYTPPAYVPVVALTGPSTGVLDGSIVLGVSVTDVPVGSIAGVELLRTYPNGETASAGFFNLRGGGSGVITVTEAIDFEFTYTARVTFTAGANADTTTSGPLVVQWSNPPAPQLTLSITDDGTIVAGDEIPVTVTAATLPGGGAGIPSGTEVTIATVGPYSTTAIGTVTLFTTPEGLSGSTTISRPIGGTESLVAVVLYGSRPWTAKSAPVSLTVAPPAGTMQLATSGFTLGATASVEVIVRATGAERDAAEAHVATVTVNGVDQTVFLRRTESTGPMRGTASVFVNGAGVYSISATAAGDGVRIGATAATTTVTVQRAASTLSMTLQPAQPASANPLRVYANAASGAGAFAPAPTGAVTLTIWPADVSCVVVDTVCDFPAESVHAGTNILIATYAGDANHRGTSAQLEFEAKPRVAYLSYESSPTEWVTGNDIRFTWSVTATGSLAPIGRVDVRYGSAYCSAPVATGTCTLSLPVPPSGVSTQPLDFSISFISADDLPGVTHTSTVMPKDCFLPALYNGTIALEYGSTCERAGRTGYTTGSVLLVTHDPVASPMAFDRWMVDGVDAGNLPTLRLTVSRSHSITFAEKYEPTCFTLTLNPVSNSWNADDVERYGKTSDRYKGTIFSTTAPNCSHPTTPTDADLRAMREGVPRYAAGTEVILRVNPIGGTPEYVIDTVTGSTALTPDKGAQSVIMDADKAVTATFKLRDCNTIDIPALQGGTVTVTALYRPQSSAYLQPWDGSCTTWNGKPGWVPGTVMSLTAKPKAGLYFGDWRVGVVAADPRLNTALPLTIVGDAPRGATAGAPNTMSFTMPAMSAGVPRIDAQFLEVRCVAVVIESQWPVGSTAYKPFSYRTLQGGPVDSLRCGGKSTTTDFLYSSGLYETRRQTDWFVGSARLVPVAATAQAPFGVDHLTYAPITSSKPMGVLAWDVDNIFAVDKEGIGVDGPELNLNFAPTGMTVTAQWMNNNCRPIVFANPQGGDVQIRNDSSNVCPAGSAILDQKLSFWAKPVAGSSLVPIFSVEDWSYTAERLPTWVAGADGRRYFSGAEHDLSVLYSPFLGLRVEYCAPLKLSTEVRNASGGFTPYQGPAGSTLAGIGVGQPGEVIADDGGCPPLYARPGQTVSAGLTTWGSYGYRIVNPTGAANIGPSFTIDAKGGMAAATMRLEAICFSVPLVDRVSTPTAGNCPHDRSKYLRGTIVQLEVDVHAGESFHGWSGADRNEGDYAWVVVDRDRTVTVDIGYPSTGQKILNVMSSVAQRVVSGLVTIATGLLLAHMLIVKGVALAMAGTSTGLRALGVSGRDMDRFDQATAVVSAQTKTFELFAGCLGSWAHGPKITEVAGNAALSAGLPAAGSAASKLAAKKLQAYLLARGSTNAAGAAAGVGYVVDAVTAFGSSHEMYFQDARDSWSRLGSSLGSCMEDGLETTWDPVFHG